MSTAQYLANQVYGEKPKMTRETVLNHSVTLAVGAFCCWAFYEDGMKKGHRQALQEVAPISHSPVMLNEYLEEKGIYMFDEEELRALRKP